MKAINLGHIKSSARPHALRPTQEILVIILGILLLASAVWQVRTLSAANAQPYQAPALDLTMSGALTTQVSLANISTLSEASFSPSAFHFTVTDAPIGFTLEFEGRAEGETSIYDLSSGTYPLTLTLLEGGTAYHSFTAAQGTVELTAGEALVSAFMVDDGGQQLFINARFALPEPSQACSESYRFCYNQL